MPQLQSLTDELNSGLGTSRPIWLSRFVRDEVRPFLIQNRETVIAALSQWFEFISDQKQQKMNWERQLNNFLSRQIAIREQDQESLKAPPSDGLALIVGSVLRNGRSETVCGWGSPDLIGWGPTVDYPLPLVYHRDLSADECVAALIAIHDEVRDPKERIGPDMNGEFSPHERITFASLRSRVLATNDEESEGLTEANLSDLRGMLKKAVTSFQTILPTVPDSTNDRPNLIARPHPACDGYDEQNEVTRQVGELTEIQLAESKLETLKLIAGDASVEIAVIASNDELSVDQRQRRIAKLDGTAYGWDSVRWGKMLGCTDRAARDTEWWRVERKKHLDDD